MGWYPPLGKARERYYEAAAHRYGLTRHGAAVLDAALVGGVLSRTGGFRDGEGPESDAAEPRIVVRVVTADGQKVALAVEVADTPEGRATGLMGRPIPGHGVRVCDRVEV